MYRRLLLAVSLAFSIWACADGGGGGSFDAGTGGSTDAARADTGPPVDGGPPRDAGRRDSGTPTTCGAGQHSCGGGCIDDLPNEPANGCRMGCGEACPAPTSGAVTCSAAGACDFTCTPPFRRQGDDCVCAPVTCEDMGATCGAPDDGCGTPLDCGGCGGGACVDGHCACTPDPREPGNDSSSLAPNLGSFADADDPPDAVHTDMNIDEASDVDWVRFSIEDATDFPFGSNPSLTVTLSQVPAGSTYALTAFYVCNGSGDATSCAQGTSNNEIGRGCATSVVGGATGQVQLETECSGTDESGTLYVRVRASVWGGSCEPHRLTLRVR